MLLFLLLKLVVVRVYLVFAFSACYRKTQSHCKTCLSASNTPEWKLNLRKQATTNIYQVQTGSEYTDTSNHSSLKRRPSARGSRPMSMYETGSGGQKPYLPVGEVSQSRRKQGETQPFRRVSQHHQCFRSLLCPAWPLPSLFSACRSPVLACQMGLWEPSLYLLAVTCRPVLVVFPQALLLTQGPWPKVSQQLWGFWLLLDPLPFLPIIHSIFPERPLLEIFWSWTSFPISKTKTL